MKKIPLKDKVYVTSISLFAVFYLFSLCNSGSFSLIEADAIGSTTPGTTLPNYVIEF